MTLYLNFSFFADPKFTDCVCYAGKKFADFERYKGKRFADFKCYTGNIFADFRCHAGIKFTAYGCYTDPNLLIVDVVRSEICNAQIAKQCLAPI